LIIVRHVAIRKFARMFPFKKEFLRRKKWSSPIPGRADFHDERIPIGRIDPAV